MLLRPPIDQPQARAVPTEPPPPEPHPTSPEGLASNLNDVLRFAPILKKAPNVALTVAKAGGNVKENAESVAAIAHARALDLAAQRLAEQERAMHGRGVLSAGFGPGGAFAGSPGLNPIPGIAHGVRGLVGEVASVAHPPQNNPAAAGTGLGTGGSAGSSAVVAAGTAPTAAAIQTGAGAITHVAAQQLNPLTLMGTPQHLYRTWMDIYYHHGAAAMVEAMIPSLVGAGAGYFLTRGGAGTEEGAVLGADIVGAGTEAADTTAAAARVAEATNSAQRTGQALRTITSTALKPVSVPAGAMMKAATAVGSSPTFLGANVGGLLTQTESAFKQSWDRTANGMPKGEIGSFGRAIPTALSHLGVPGLEPGSTAYKVISGGLDGFTNIAILDPLGAGGRVIGQARSAEGFGGVLGHFYGGTGIQSPADIERIMKQYRGARAFVADVPNLNAGEITLKYGSFGVPPEMAKMLGRANTQEDVVNVLKDMARATEMSSRTMSMPMLTRYIGIRAAGAQTRLGAALTTPLPTMYDPELMAFNGREFTMGDPFAVESIMHLLRAAGETPQAVTLLGTKLLESADPQLWANELRKTSEVVLGRMVAKALGDSPVAQAMMDSIEKHATEMFGGEGAGFEGAMGSTFKGEDRSYVMHMNQDGSLDSRIGAIWFTQQGKAIMPTLRNVQKTAKDIAEVVKYSSAKGLYFKGQNLRDWLDLWVNHRFFQPLALATGGWALRVSSSEVLLNALRLGPLNFSAAAIARSAVKHDLALGLIQQDPAALADMDRLQKLLDRGIQSSEAKTFAARAGQNLTRHLIAAVRGVLAGTQESMLVGLSRQRYLDAATKLIILHDGYMVPGAISSAHNYPLYGQDQVTQSEADIAANERRFGTQRAIKNVTLPEGEGAYSFLRPRESGYYGALSGHQGLISRDLRLGRPQAQALLGHLDAGMTEQDALRATIEDSARILRDLPNAELRYMARYYGKEPESDALTNIDDWARVSTESLLGAVKGQFGGLNRDMLADIAHGSVPPTAKDMMKKYGDIPLREMPTNVPGLRPHMGGGTGLQRAASWLHTNYLSRIVNYLSREPTYIADFANESKLLETQVREGTISQDQADVIAQTRAIFKTIRFIHNPQDRMNVEQALHIVAPFWFAKNQAIRRVGRLFASNPGAAEQYLKLNLAVQNMAFHANQNNGSASFVFPVSGVVGTAVTGGVNQAGRVPLLQGLLGDVAVGSIPVGLSGSLDTMQTMVPWSGNGEAQPGSPLSLEQTLASPALGPLGSVPVRAFADFTTGHVHDIADTALGPVGAHTPWWTYLLPNSVLQHFVEIGAFEANSNSLGTSAYSSFLQAISAIAEQDGGTMTLTQVIPSDITGTAPPPGTTFANAWQQAQIIKRAKNMTTANLIIKALIGAVSPVSVTLSRADLTLSNEFQAYVKAAKGNISLASDKFFKDHPDAVAATLFQSTSDVGSGYGDTSKDGQWMQANSYAIHNYPNAAQFLIPPADNVGPFSESTHLLQMAENIRHENTPIEYLQQLAISSGNAWYYNGIKPSLDAALKANPGNAYHIYAAYDKIVQNYGQHRNPLWFTYWQGQASGQARVTAIDQMTRMLADPKIPKNTQTTHLAALLAAYRDHQGQLASAGSSAEKAILKEQWQNKLTATAKAWPDVSVAITDLFSHLK